MTSGDERGHTGHAVGMRFLPVSVHHGPEAARLEHLARGLRREPDRGGNSDERFDIADVGALDEVRPKQRVMDRIPARLGVGPGTQFLRQAAVVGHGAIAVRQPFGRHAFAHLRLHLGYVEAAAGEQIRQAAPLRRCVRMQREMNPLDLDVVFFPEPLDTHGTEITPGSDVVGKDFHHHRFGHHGL